VQQEVMLANPSPSIGRLESEFAVCLKLKWTILILFSGVEDKTTCFVTEQLGLVAVTGHKHLHSLSATNPHS